jgi:hypothetical protein
VASCPWWQKKPDERTGVTWALWPFDVAVELAMVIGLPLAAQPHAPAPRLDEIPPQEFVGPRIGRYTDELAHNGRAVTRS